MIRCCHVQLLARNDSSWSCKCLMSWLHMCMSCKRPPLPATNDLLAVHVLAAVPYAVEVCIEPLHHEAEAYDNYWKYHLHLQ
jgi:hypothetical protein